jgi:hypothetical protein
VTPGTLPVLRFGRQYRFRVRKADINGDGLGANASGDLTSASDPVPFLRLEPVAPAQLAFGTTATAGESPAQVVVRSGPSVSGVQEAIRYVLPPDTGMEIALMHGVFDGANGIPDKAANTRFRSGAAWSHNPPGGPLPAKADVFAATTFASKPAIPYLPDPAARAVVLRPMSNAGTIGLGGDDPRLSAPFVGPLGGYPDGWQAAEIHLTVSTGAGSARVDGSAIRISLPPGKRMSFRMTTAVVPALLPQMAAVNWAGPGLPPGGAAAVLSAGDGGLPSLTPSRLVTMVHAAQQPLAAPVFAVAPVVAPRAPGSTTTVVSGSVTVDAESTMSVGLVAQWSEWNDDRQELVERSMKVGEPHRVVTGNTVSFAEMVQLRTTAHVDLTLTPVATSAFAEMFAPGTDCTRAGAAFTVSVPASQAPPTPKIAYAVPTFAWTESRPDAMHVVRKRAGNAVRLWLERPWFSSGVGEKLAVLVGASRVTGGSDPGLAVSRWGIDPVTRTSENPATGAPFGIEDFIDPTVPRVIWVKQGNEPVVQLALHEVQSDKTSGQYWCDVVFDPSKFGGAYRPFVELVVAAYQPQAMVQQLSELARVQMIQVFPDREVRVSLEGDRQPSVSVQLEGPFPLFPDDITRGLYTLADLEMELDGQAVQVVDDVGNGDVGKGGGGHKPPVQAPTLAGHKPRTSPPSFKADRTFSVDSGGYVPELKTGWKSFSLVVREEEMCSFFTTDFTKYKLPNGMITIDKPPPGVPFEFAVFPSDPSPRSLRMVYQDSVVITKE